MEAWDEDAHTMASMDVRRYDRSTGGPVTRTPQEAQGVGAGVGQDSTGQHRTARDRTGQHSTAQHNTDKHRTAGTQNSTGQHMTAGAQDSCSTWQLEHRTAQDSK